MHSQHTASLRFPSLPSQPPSHTLSPPLFSLITLHHSTNFKTKNNNKRRRHTHIIPSIIIRRSNCCWIVPKAMPCSSLNSLSVNDDSNSNNNNVASARNFKLNESTFLASLMPKKEIGVDRFLHAHPNYDGRGALIAIFDSGVDPAAAGLQVTSDGKPKILDVLDCTGSGDVDTSKVVKADADGCISGASGASLVINTSWKNPSGDWHVGYKLVYELFTDRLTSRMKMNVFIAYLLCYFVTMVPWLVLSSGESLLVNMTLVQNARATAALCLDGSLPAYHLHRGFGAGQNNWLLQFEGGGWCNDLTSCLERAQTRRGSTRYMSKLEVFNGILSNNASLNPDFYNWNRVKLRYCDGASFTGDAVFINGTARLYFKGQKIWEAIIQDLLPKGLGKANKALLSGCSAGGLATFHHCDNFAKYLPNATVKCLSDAGFFLDGRDISMNHTMRYFVKSLVTLQGVEKNLNRNCTSTLFFPDLCFFPQYVLRYITTPYFILNSAYDVFQFHHILVPPSADIHGHWNRCKQDPAACTPEQINVLQVFRNYMVATLRPFYIYSARGGMFINSCFAHCQSELPDTWFGDDSPRVNNKTIARAVGDWYFSRNRSKEIDCPYPCDKTCHNLIPSTSTGSIDD